MNQSERNGYNKTSYGDYRTIERDEGLPMDQATGARVFVNRVYNWMFCGLMITTVLAWATAKYAVSSETAMRQVMLNFRLESFGMQIIVSIFAIITGICTFYKIHMTC